MIGRALLVVAVLVPGLARAGAWVREPGHFYVDTSWSHVDTTRYYTTDFNVVPIQPYRQDVLGVYGDVGLLDRWLGATVEGTLYRRNEIEGQGYTEGVGDFRVGLWTQLAVKPFHLAIGFLLGVPTGDARPTAGPGASPDAELVARSLPTGDGEWDLEPRLSIGHAFGGVHRWPLRHYAIGEVGYWVRTNGFAHAFTWRAELGTQLPYRFVDRFWLVLRAVGVESFASAAEASRDATGLGNGVTYVAPGVHLYGRIWRGLGASVGVDGAVRGRSVPDAAQLRVTVSWQR